MSPSGADSHVSFPCNPQLHTTHSRKMPYTIKCPHCKELLKVEEAWAGMESTCPSCNGAFDSGYAPPADDCKVLAISGLVITVFCCGGLGLILAIIAHSKMRQSGVYTYRPVCIATYIIFSLNIILFLLCWFFNFT